MRSNEPEIMGTTKSIVKKFCSFLARNLYFVFALFFLNFFYTFVILKFVDSQKIKFFANLIFNISFYPVIMVFVMYIVNLYYAGKKNPNLKDIIEQGKKYFQPLVLYYIGITLLRGVIPMQFGVFVMALLVKLAFVDQVIYYRNCTVIDAMKVSWRMVSLRLFFVFFVGFFVGTNILNSIAQQLFSSGEIGMFFSIGVNIFVFVLLKFLLTIFYRELIKLDFYSSKV